jgi:D-amino peptidase
VKIYVSVDMEGIGGIVLSSQLRQGEPHYAEGRRLLTEEVNAVVQGLLDAGATDIVVKDAHGTGYNFLVDQLHPGALYFMGAAKADKRFPGLDASFDGALLIGYHAMAGKLQAVRDHTFSSKSYTGIELNGKPIGEIGIDSLLFGLHGVPVLMVSGDDATCEEAKRQLGEVTTYETKKAVGRHSALMKAPKRVHAEIKQAIAQALSARSKARPYTLPGPYELTLRFLSTDLADGRYCDGRETIRVDGLTVVYKDTDLVRLFSRAL